MFILVLLSLVSASEACTTVNGIAGACDLRMNQFTFAGSHNSGVGAWGGVWHWSGIQALSCVYRSQDKSITEQMELGIRYFDFHVAYISADQASGDYWEEGIVIVNKKAYARSLKKALVEIELFMQTHPDTVVVIRIKDVAKDSVALVKEHLPETLDFLMKGRYARLGFVTNVLLKNAVDHKMNIFVFVEKSIYTYHSQPRVYMNELQQVESYMGASGTSSCFGVEEMFRKLQKDHSTYMNSYQVQIDWYLSKGLCVKELAGLCNDGELNKLEEINKKIIAYNYRPVNLVLVDYVGSGSVRVADVVKRMNEYNVKMKDTFKDGY